MRNKSSNLKPSITLGIILTLLAILIALANYIRLPIANHNDFVKYAVHFFILSCAVIGVFLFIASEKWVFLIIGPILLICSIASAACLYFYNITITSEIIEVILKTDWSVTREFVNMQLILVCLLAATVTFLIIYYRFTLKIAPTRRVVIMVLSVLMMLPAFILNKKRNNTITSRVPFSIISATKEYRQALEASKVARETIAQDAIYTGNDSLIVVLVLGESLRNDHLGLNGYDRNTTPRLSKREIYSFNKNKSLFTYTAGSVPQILTRADKEHPERAHSEKSVISIFERCGFETTWLANQVPDYTYSGIAKACNKYEQLNGHTSTYSDIIMTDENILSVLPKHINSSSKKAKLLVLHTMGSHWYYNYRCPEEMRLFKPTTTSRSFSNNSSMEMINSYDNTVLFTDYFIDNVIRELEDKQAIMIYASDHGESLGEDNRWLHAFEHETLHDAACLIWMSDTYKSMNPRTSAISENLGKPSTTSNIFHTLLDAGKIDTEFLDYRLSLISNKYEGE